MTSRWIICQQQKGEELVGGSIRSKNFASEGRNRRAFNDIGNLISLKSPKLKPQAHISESSTRNSQLVINNNSLPPEREKTRTTTSILTTRSRAACRLVSDDKQKDPININISDVDNEFAVVEYVEEIYKFYKLTENETQIHDYMDSQPGLNEKARAVCIDWLIEVHNRFKFMPETLYLTVNLVDRFLCLKTVPRSELQLVCIGATLIACKYEEIYTPKVNEFVCVSDNVYTNEQVLRMEKTILGKLEWNLTVPTPYVFLVRFIKASISDNELENMVYFLAELAMMSYSALVYCPSMVAASAVYVARCTLHKSPVWTETLKLHIQFTVSQLIDCAKLLVTLHSTAADSKMKAVFKKYSKPKHC